MKALNKKNIGKCLMALREEKGVTINEFSRDLGISLSAAYKYEHGERTPRDETKVLIADYYEADVKHIFFKT